MKDYNAVMERYFLTKDVYEKNQILKRLVIELPLDGKDFFLQAYKKARFLDMKLTAVRGYAAYANEKEVNVLMARLLELLIKVPDKTPYAYQEYEIMRSAFLMQYLLKTYNYECFRAFHDQLEKQYNAMPDCFKNAFSLDDEGNSYSIRNPDEVSKSWDDFWNRSYPI